MYIYNYLYIYLSDYLSTYLAVSICLRAGVVTSTRPWTPSCTRSATRTSRSLSRECCADPPASTETPRCSGHRGKLEKLITIFNFSTLSNYIWMFSVPHLVTFDLCVIKVDIVMILFIKLWNIFLAVKPCSRENMLQDVLCPCMIVWCS